MTTAETETVDSASSHVLTYEAIESSSSAVAYCTAAGLVADFPRRLAAYWAATSEEAIAKVVEWNGELAASAVRAKAVAARAVIAATGRRS